MSHYQLAGQQLTEKDLLNVMEELADVRAKWYNIGLGLGLDVGTLNCIKTENSNASDCLRETLMKWLSTYPPPPAWSKVVETLRTKTVDEAKLAADLERKYCQLQDTITATATQFSVPTTLPHHPTQDTSTGGATLSPQFTVPTTPPHHPTQDTSTGGAALSPQSVVPTTPPHHPTQEHMGMPLAIQ